MQVFRGLPEGTLAEVIDDVLYMSPAPTPFHQLAIGNLHLALATFVQERKLGTVFLSPIDVYLDEDHNAVQPDLLFVSKENKLVVARDGLHGSPDLVIEVLSPTNAKHDTMRKKALYEKFGVKEYWIVDPDTRHATGFMLTEKSYIALPEEVSRLVSPMLGASFSY